MEKKTIGAFIAALRKANGMTQRDLAEQLNVSDKTVSRWECDEGCPDLSLIPVIAELFGITCDELLRGERRSPAERHREQDREDDTPRSDSRTVKLRRQLLRSALVKYKNRTCIAMGISGIGLIAALICNLVFYRGLLGFLLGSVFFLAGIVCQTVFLNRAMFSVDDEEFSNLPELNRFKRTAIRLAEQSVGLTACLIGFTAPLALLMTKNISDGLDGESMLGLGLIGAGIALVLSAMTFRILNARFLRRGVYTMEQKEAQVYTYNGRLMRRCILIFAAVLAATLVLWLAVSAYWGVIRLAEGKVFTDYESFAAFMEQDADPYGGSAIRVPVDSIHDGQEDIPRETLLDGEGNVLISYIPRNESVSLIDWADNSSRLPITVYSRDDLRAAGDIVALRNACFGMVCLLEAGTAFGVYWAKRKKMP